MAGYIGSKSSVTLVDGYTEAEADAEFVTKTGDTMSGNLNVTGTVTSDGLTVDGGTTTEIKVFSQGRVSPTTLSEGASGAELMVGSSNPLTLGTSNTERMRIDSSGNLLVGKTSSSLATDGIEAKANGSLFVTRSSAAPVSLRRSTTDGEIIAFYKDGTTVGSIDASGANLIVQGSISAGKTGIKFGGSQWIPQDNGNSDGGVDLGMLSVRFDDVFATNGTIQTSDFNEKQDIASLTATEMLVGKRISTLFKTFRWKDSVAEKGDNARTHTGVIAQDVQAAFTAEGLDAGDYALFISSTWWETQTEVPAVEAVAEVTDEDGNVTTEAVEAKDAYTRTDTYDTEAEAPEGATSKTRMGIRYPELLSFVAAYNEQRFASIEARLTALEA